MVTADDLFLFDIIDGNSTGYIKRFQRRRGVFHEQFLSMDKRLRAEQLSYRSINRFSDVVNRLLRRTIAPFRPGVVSFRKSQVF